VTINNIVAPGDVGSTYTIEITPEAQRKCNNSPTFNQFPPTVICADAPLMFDHSAKDPDGDQLVYSFCAPLTGGGPATQNALISGSCSGAYPNPACPPPYGNVTFIQPLYTPVAPMGGNPVVRIDPNTGLITGTPRLQGQFVVGVCVEEFDKVTGKLLSKVFRDFQFNVAACDPTVVADIKENRVIKDKEFLVNSFGKTDFKFVNESYQRQYINAYEWTFNIGGQKVVSKDWEPTVTFPGVGTYNGTLVLNPNTSCGDTARIFVQIFPDITADELAKVIPTKDTRVLIYCNNNFENEERAFATKMPAASLNVHTFNVLHAYGYTNVHELKPLLDVRTTRIPFAGTAADGHGRSAQR
jgi:hypothetical protein